MPNWDPHRYPHISGAAPYDTPPQRPPSNWVDTSYHSFSPYDTPPQQWPPVNWADTSYHSFSHYPVPSDTTPSYPYPPPPTSYSQPLYYPSAPQYNALNEPAPAHVGPAPPASTAISQPYSPPVTYPSLTGEWGPSTSYANTPQSLPPPYGQSQHPWFDSRPTSQNLPTLNYLPGSHSFSHSASWSHQSFSSSGSQGDQSPYQPTSNTLILSSTELDLAPNRCLQYVWLYGTLHVEFHSASNLPNMDLFSESLRQALTVLDNPQNPLTYVQNQISTLTSKRITSDPYVSLILRGATVARTRVISNSQDPVWDESFKVPVAHKVAEVKLVVKDNDMLGAQFIGQVKIPAEILLSKEIKAHFFDLLNKDGKPCKPGAQLKVSLRYTSVDKDPLYKDGVGAGPYYQGVPHTYFPLRKGGRVTLYQDAHVPSHCLPEIKLEGGVKYEHRSCWEDICDAILDARYLIYIAGWSIYTKVRLIRDKHNSRPRGDLAYKELGEILKAKANEVHVSLLVWDDKTSHSTFHQNGIMGTHDEETRKYFKHTKVRCLLAPRYADSKLSWMKQQVVGTLYTHHQKIVIVDANGPGGRRRLVSFIGGLDLCDGRYDTPRHTLFRDLNTYFKDDYHNPMFPTKVDSGGPREPWHDLHCKLEGAAAHDVLKNFEQRWKKMAKWHGFSLKFPHTRHLHDHSLLNLVEVPIIRPDNYGSSGDVDVIAEYDSETWHVQVFRSIDSGSVKGFPKSFKEAEQENLVGRKNVAVDMSIHTAYIKAIRSAQHFIYIENQYFLGSSFAWPSYKNAGADHLVPIEIALKIISKIKAGDPFAVYVVIPMWPEGAPDSRSVQEILYFQRQTMEMMYKLISEALRDYKLENKYVPTDFLQFFCLGNREPRGASETNPKTVPAEGSPQAQALKSRRFMIYVHAKGMIVDDEYVIIGSANINQRSMDGSRDTEIAMGAYQPYYTWGRKQHAPKGQVYGYRMSLWAEHFGGIESCFSEPWSKECVKKVQTMTREFWNQYTASEVTQMKGHLLPYPVNVGRNGEVTALEGFECFPDIGGKILGASTNLPDNLTS